MGYYEFTESKDDLEAAGTDVRKMIKQLENAIRNGGFDDEAVVDLVMDWTEAGKIARGEGYWTSTRMVWKTTYKPGDFGRKTSLELLDRLKQLERALIRRTDISERFDRFNGVEDALLRFVHEYRTALRKRDLAQLRTFDGQMALALYTLKPDYYKELGD